MRDKDLLRAFEIADDSLQGILGYYMYVGALQHSAKTEEITKYLPDDHFPMTFSWIRYYDKQDLIRTFQAPVLELYQGRICLTLMVAIFDATLNSFITNLERKGHKQTLANRKLAGCLRWAYQQLSSCHIGDTEAIKRLPKTFGIIDNARRLRNLIIHNHGLFNEKYCSDILQFKDIVVDMHPNYPIYKANPKQSVPIVIDNQYFLRFGMAHLEVLHLLHNHLQKTYFGHETAYDYREEKKPIEWNKALWGDAKVVFQPAGSLSAKDASNALFRFEPSC